MHAYISKMGGIESVNGINMQAEISDEIEPADTCSGEVIPFVWTPSGCVSFEFEGRSYYADFAAYWGEDNGRKWCEIDTDSTEGLMEECAGGGYQPIALERLQALEKAAGGQWHFWDCINRAMASAARAAMESACEFLRECRAEEESAA